MAGTSIAERREVRYAGRVQGVGFRYSTRTIAGRYRVVGYVRNLADGSVELVAEGETEELDRFLSDVAGQMAKNVSDVMVNRTEASANFSGFEIRF